MAEAASTSKDGQKSKPVDDGVNNDLDGVGVGEEVDNLHGVLDDAYSQDLLAIVAAVHHERVGEALNDGALRLAEALLRVPSRRVRQVRGVLRRRHRQVVAQRDVLHLHVTKWFAVKSTAGSRRRSPKRREDPLAYVDIIERPAVKKLHILLRLRLLMRRLLQHLRHGRDRESCGGGSKENVEMANLAGAE
jgi:hypothetical protein